MTSARERRTAPRRSSVDEHDVIATRIRPGHHARLVDVSAGGALLDTPFRLLPGAVVELRLSTRGQQQIVVRGEVLRCAVVQLRPVIYRGAIRFDREVASFAAVCGYPLHIGDASGNAASREEATRGAG